MNIVHVIGDNTGHENVLNLNGWFGPYVHGQGITCPMDKIGIKWNTHEMNILYPTEIALLLTRLHRLLL